MQEENTEEQYTKRNVDWLKPYQYKKGQSGNITGRKGKGESLKEYSKRRLANLSDPEKEDYLEGLDKKDIWEMAEGKPNTSNELNLKGDLSISIAEAIQKKYDNTSTSSAESSS